MDSPSARLLSSISEHRGNPDFLIACRASTWAVHQAVLIPSSRFFEALCTGPFIESTQRAVDLSDDEPDLVEMMLSFLYLGEYTVLPSAPYREEGQALGTKASGQSSVAREHQQLATRHLEMYALADKFDIPSLRAYSGARFARVIRYSSVQPPSRFPTAGEEGQLSSSCAPNDAVFDFASVVDLVYSSPAVASSYERGGELRDAVFRQYLRTYGSLETDLQLEHLFEDRPDVLSDFAERMTEICRAGAVARTREKVGVPNDDHWLVTRLLYQC